MKRLLSILLFIPILGFSQYTAIPDQNFEQILIGLGYDDVIDGQVLTANIISVDSLEISFGGIDIINDLTGIEDFTALTFLICSNTNISSLDLSQNSALTYLSCNNNQLTSLDVSGCTVLTHLYCMGNQLTSLDVSSLQSLNRLFCRRNPLITLDLSQNTALQSLACTKNQLTNLDISQNTDLRGLQCGYNQLINLDLSQNSALTYLSCDSNQLTSLDLSNNLSLGELECMGNQLTSLDVSQNTALYKLDCQSNQLTCLNIKNGNNLNMFDAIDNFITFYSNDNPNLTCIEVDDPTWSTQNWTNIDNGVTFSTNCNYPAGCFTNSIEEYQSNLSIFPNPTNNLIQIEIENYNGKFEAELYDFTGKILETTNKTSLSLADYPRGIYLLKVAYGDRVEQLKVVKE